MKLQDEGIVVEEEFVLKLWSRLKVVLGVLGGGVD